MTGQEYTGSSVERQESALMRFFEIRYSHMAELLQHGGCLISFSLKLLDISGPASLPRGDIPIVAETTVANIKFDDSTKPVAIIRAFSIKEKSTSMAQRQITARMYIGARNGRLGLSGAAARCFATSPLGPFGLGATSPTCTRYAQLRKLPSTHPKSKLTYLPFLNRYLGIIKQLYRLAYVLFIDQSSRKVPV